MKCRGPPARGPSEGEDAKTHKGRRWLILAGLPMERASWPLWATSWQLSKSVFALLDYSTSLCQECRDRDTHKPQWVSSLSCSDSMTERGRTCAPESLSCSQVPEGREKCWGWTGVVMDWTGQLAGS